MRHFKSMAALALVSFSIIAGGCVVTPEHRMHTAASEDDSHRGDFERCRAQGRTDCDAILNAPVDSNTSRGDSVQEQERRDAYHRCVDRGGTDCDNLLPR